MHLEQLTLENFRNHQKFEFHFKPEDAVTYIIGPNGQGKTNILEAIYLLALTKSFRAKQNDNLIKWDAEYARVKANFALSKAISDHEAKSSLRSLSLEAFLGLPPNPQKVFKKNDVKTSATHFIGNFQVVFFHPEDLNMLYLGPDLRRAYLNNLNLQISKTYFHALKKYQQVLKQRNALLASIKKARFNGTYSNSQNEQLELWTEPFIENGALLQYERAKTVAYLNKHITQKYQEISGGHEEVRIIYQPALGQNTKIAELFAELATYEPEENDTSEVGINGAENALEVTPFASLPDFWQNTLKQAIAESLAKDTASERTNVGPHRDDMQILLNNKPLAVHASRGEYRSVLLALKLLELEFFAQKSGNKALLLLDDVFSELDLLRQKALLKAIQEHQTVITTTHIDDDMVPGAKIYLAD